MRCPAWFASKPHYARRQQFAQATGFMHSSIADTAIKGSGALNSTSEGLQTLVKIATYERNDRPKWSDIRKHGDTTTKFLRIPEKITLAKERQALLVELAPVLVEMKLLEP